jgi:hypothetical protein
MRADLRLPRPAPVASPASVDERHSDAISHRERRNLGACLGHNSGELVTRYMRQRDDLAAMPGMPIRSTDSGRLYIDDGAIRWTFGGRDLSNAERGTHGLKDNSAHSPVVPAAAVR